MLYEAGFLEERSVKMDRFDKNYIQLNSICNLEGKKFNNNINNNIILIECYSIIMLLMIYFHNIMCYVLLIIFI